MENIKSNSTITKGLKSSQLLTELVSYAKIIVLAVIIAFICNNYIIVNAQIPSDSMCNGIKTGDRLFGFRFSYLYASPKRGDVVIFKYPDDETQNYVKRIIGLPGDIVVIKDSKVYVNDVLLDEPYIREPMAANSQVLTYSVPKGYYFMMGDNRNNSLDSRFWKNTYVAKDKILAKAIFKYYDTHIVFQMIK